MDDYKWMRIEMINHIEIKKKKKKEEEREKERDGG
jgi:hypothetical protein